MLLLVARVRPSIEERMRKFDMYMGAFAYRAPTKGDLIPGAEFIMVDVERYMENGRGTDPNSIYGTRIKLDDEPIRPSNAYPEKEVVFYHCTMPAWNGQCFIHLDDFMASGYRDGCHMNDTRYLTKNLGGSPWESA